MEPLFHDRDIERYRRWPNHQVITLDGDGMTDVNLVSICEDTALDTPARIVIVDDAHKLKGDKALKQYISDKSPLNNDTVLVALARSEKCPSVWATAAKKGKLTEHRKLKTYEPNNEVVAWIKDEAQKRTKLSLGAGVAEALFQVVGNNLHRLASEMRKLQVLTGTDVVTLQDLARIILPSVHVEPYQVAEAALTKDRRLAMNNLSTVYRTMGDDANVPVCNALMRQVERYIVIKALLERGDAENDIAASIGMNPWVVKEKVLPQVRKHQLPDLIRAMSRLCQLDVDVKGSARSKRTHVELAVLQIAGKP